MLQVPLNESLLMPASSAAVGLNTTAATEAVAARAPAGVPAQIAVGGVPGISVPTAVAPNIPTAGPADGAAGKAEDGLPAILVCACFHTKSVETFTLHKFNDTEGIDTKERKNSIQTAFIPFQPLVPIRMTRRRKKKTLDAAKLNAACNNTAILTLNGNCRLGGLLTGVLMWIYGSIYPGLMRIGA